MTVTGSTVTITVSPAGATRPKRYFVVAFPEGGGSSVMVSGAGPDLAMTGLKPGVSYGFSSSDGNSPRATMTSSKAVEIVIPKWVDRPRLPAAQPPPATLAPA